MSRNMYPAANRGPVGVPLGHQMGDESLGPGVVTNRNVEGELVAPYEFFPRRQTIRSGYYMLNPAEATLYEAPVSYYMGPNIIGRRTTQAGASSRIRNQLGRTGQEAGNA